MVEISEKEQLYECIPYHSEKKRKGNGIFCNSERLSRLPKLLQ